MAEFLGVNFWSSAGMVLVFPGWKLSILLSLGPCRETKSLYLHRHAILVTQHLKYYPQTQPSKRSSQNAKRGLVSWGQN